MRLEAPRRVARRERIRRVGDRRQAGARAVDGYARAARVERDDRLGEAARRVVHAVAGVDVDQVVRGIDGGRRPDRAADGGGRHGVEPPHDLSRERVERKQGPVDAGAVLMRGRADVEHAPPLVRARRRRERHRRGKDVGVHRIGRVGQRPAEVHRKARGLLAVRRAPTVPHGHRGGRLRRRTGTARGIRVQVAAGVAEVDAAVGNRRR